MTSNWLSKALSDRKNYEEKQSAKRGKGLQKQELVEQYAKPTWIEIRSAVSKCIDDFNLARGKDLILIDPEESTNQKRFTLVVDDNRISIEFSPQTGIVTVPGGSYEPAEVQQNSLRWKDKDGNVLTSQEVAECEIGKAVVPR